MDIPKEGLRLNVGCGRHVLEGWVNIDLAPSTLAHRAPDIIADAQSIPLPDGCANTLMAIHLWEHLYRWECEPTIEEWKRLMRPGALLVMEMPDVFKFCRNILEGNTKSKHEDDLGLWGMWGDPRDKDPLMAHHWGWSFSTLAPFLQAHGFVKCKEEDTQWHCVGRFHRDFRIEAFKA